MNRQIDPVDNKTEDPLLALRDLRVEAPDGLAPRLMQALRTDSATTGLITWPFRQGKLVILAQAALVILLLSVLMVALRPRGTSEDGTRLVTFEVYAQSAQAVDLLGDFTGWESLRMRPAPGDARSGRWVIEVKLASGRHEYGFLIDGTEWKSDPSALAHRPDGFGNQNAILQL